MPRFAFAIYRNSMKLGTVLAHTRREAEEIANRKWSNRWTSIGIGNYTH